MVKIKRSNLRTSLAYVEINAKATRSAPLVGQTTDNGFLDLWQTGGYMRVWDRVEVEEGDEPLVFAVPCSNLKQIVDSFSSKQISLKAVERKLHLSSGKSRVRIPFYTAAEDSVVPPPEVEKTMTVGGDFVSALTEGAAFLAKTDEKPTLSCYSIHQRNGSLRIVASNDAFNLYSRDIPYSGDDFDPILLPRECGQTISKAFNKSKELSIGLTSNDLVVVTEIDGTRVLATAQFTGMYPDAGELIDSEVSALFSAPKSSLLDMCKLSSHMTDSGLLSFEGVGDEIRVRFPKTQSIDGDLYLEGSKVLREFPRIYFNVGFVSNCLNVVDDDEISFSAVKGRYAGGAFTFTGSGQPRTYCYKVSYTDTV